MLLSGTFGRSPLKSNTVLDPVDCLYAGKFLPEAELLSEPMWYGCVCSRRCWEIGHECLERGLTTSPRQYGRWVLVTWPEASRLRHCDRHVRRLRPCRHDAGRGYVTVNDVTTVKSSENSNESE